jgi:hypothetical protein
MNTIELEYSVDLYLKFDEIPELDFNHGVSILQGKNLVDHNVNSISRIMTVTFISSEDPNIVDRTISYAPHVVYYVDEDQIKSVLSHKFPGTDLDIQCICVLDHHLYNIDTLKCRYDQWV